jgi:hypothetical protein
LRDWGLRGWAASLLAGAACYLILGVAPFVALQLAGSASLPPGSPPVNLVLISCSGLPLGLAFGWLVWRTAYRAGPGPSTQGPAASAAGETAA